MAAPLPPRPLLAFAGLLCRGADPWTSRRAAGPRLLRDDESTLGSPCIEGSVLATQFSHLTGGLATSGQTVFIHRQIARLTYWHLGVWLAPGGRLSFARVAGDV